MKNLFNSNKTNTNTIDTTNNTKGVIRQFENCLLLVAGGYGDLSSRPKKKTLLHAGEGFLVAGVGLEPHDLRVMSPTSYQLLHPAIYAFQPLYGTTVFAFCQGRKLSSGAYAFLFVKTMQKEQAY